MKPPVATSSEPLSAFAVYNSKKKKKNRRKAKTNGYNGDEKRDSDSKLTQLYKLNPASKAIGKKKARKSIEKVANNSPASKTQKMDVSDNPFEAARNLFKWLSAPISCDVFFKSYWEAKPLHIKRPDEEYYKRLFTSESLDKAVREHTLLYGRNVDVVTYEDEVKEVHNPEGKVTPFSLWDYYSNGCSIRVLNPQTYNERVHFLVATLQEFFGSMVGANLYLTPPGSQGFAPHYDDIEAFIIQLEGRKHWKLYQPKGKDVLARYSSPNLKRSDLGEPQELTLEAGDLLYFPRGTIHEASTDAESHSLHITISMYQNTSYADLLETVLPKALKAAAQADVNFRKGLPLHYLKHIGKVTDESSKKDLIKRTVEELVTDLIKYIDVDEAGDELGRRLIRDSMPPVVGKSERERTLAGEGPHLIDGKVQNWVELEPETNIRLLRYYCVRLVHDDHSPKLYYSTENANVYHGEEEKSVEVDLNMVPVIKALQESYPEYILIEDLPMENEEVKRQIVKDLWELGILITREPNLI